MDGVPLLNYVLMLLAALGHRNKILRAIENIRDHPIIQHKDLLGTVPFALFK